MSRAGVAWLVAVAVVVLGLPTGATAASVGHVTEFPGISHAGGPWLMTEGPDGNMWFVEDPGNRVGLIDPTAATLAAPHITEFTSGISANSHPIDIVTGADGNLWFTERMTHRIGQMTPAGVVLHEFSAGITGTDVYGITEGPDASVWFTEPIANKIGRIDQLGNVTEFPLPTGGSAPHDIAAGPDGKLWFTEYFGNRIGRIDPAVATPAAPQITEYPAASAGSVHPFSIALGPDNAMWFTDDGANKIGRIDPATATPGTPGITEYAVNAKAGDLVTGPDDNIWFTQANMIGRLTTAGIVTDFSAGISPGSNPGGIATGPDNTLWFTEFGGDRIGRIRALNAPPTVSITAPANGGHYQQNRGLAAEYTCSDPDGPGGLASCVGSVKSASAIDTSALGVHTFTVTATDKGNGHSSQIVHYTIDPATVSPAGVTLTKLTGQLGLTGLTFVTPPTRHFVLDYQPYSGAPRHTGLIVGALPAVCRSRSCNYWSVEQVNRDLDTLRLHGIYVTLSEKRVAKTKIAQPYRRYTVRPHFTYDINNPHRLHPGDVFAQTPKLVRGAGTLLGSSAQPAAITVSNWDASKDPLPPCPINQLREDLHDHMLEAPALALIAKVKGDNPGRNGGPSTCNVRIEPVDVKGSTEQSHVVTVKNADDGKPGIIVVIGHPAPSDRLADLEGIKSADLLIELVSGGTNTWPSFGTHWELPSGNSQFKIKVIDRTNNYDANGKVKTDFDQHQVVHLFFDPQGTGRAYAPIPDPSTSEGYRIQTSGPGRLAVEVTRTPHSGPDLIGWTSINVVERPKCYVGYSGWVYHEGVSPPVDANNPSSRTGCPANTAGDFFGPLKSLWAYLTGAQDPAGTKALKQAKSAQAGVAKVTTRSPFCQLAAGARVSSNPQPGELVSGPVSVTPFGTATDPNMLQGHNNTALCVSLPNGDVSVGQDKGITPFYVDFGKLDLIAAGAGNVIAAGAGNVVEVNARGDLVVLGADGHVISGGAGNVIAIGTNGQALVLGPHGNVISGGAGNWIAAGAGNIVKLDTGGNVIVTDEAGKVISGGAGNILAQGPNASIEVKDPGGNVISGGAGNLIAAGAGNLIAAGAGNLSASALGLQIGKLIAAGAGNILAGNTSNLISGGAGNLIGVGKLISGGAGN